MSNPLSDVYAQSGDRPSCMELESALLDGAAAIHCLTAERNQLRVRLESQELELVRLRAANEDLRRQIAVIGESYMHRLALPNCNGLVTPCKRWSKRKWNQQSCGPDDNLTMHATNTIDIFSKSFSTFV